MSARRDLTPLLAVAVLAIAAAAAHSAGLVGADVLHFIPLLALALPLLAGRYVGEDRIAGLAAAVARPAVRRARPARPGRIRPRATTPRGGALLARSLARRGPPALRA